MIDREQIIQYLKDFAVQKDYCYAMWLEGADGLGVVDEFSDIDFWFDVEKSHQDSFVNECVEELKKLGEIDSRVDDFRTEVSQSNVHLKNTSEYLTLDICVQSHEIRGDDSAVFYEGDIAELPLVLFDKINIVKMKKRGELDLEKMNHLFNSSKSRILQDSRVRKYINRGYYLEAYMKYLDTIAYPLVTIARLIYTSENFDYELCHISSHLPKEVVEELEPVFQVKGMEDFVGKIEVAKQLLEKYEKQFKEKYGLENEN